MEKSGMNIFAKLLAIFAIFCISFTSLPLMQGDIEVMGATKTSITTKATATGTSTIKVSWNKIKTPYSGYVVYRNGQRIKWFTKGYKYTSFTDSGLKSGTKYRYQVGRYKKYYKKQWYNKKTKKWQTKKPKKKYRGKSRKVAKYSYSKTSKSVYATTKKPVTPTPSPTPTLPTITGVKSEWKKPYGGDKEQMCLSWDHVTKGMIMYYRVYLNGKKITEDDTISVPSCAISNDWVSHGSTYTVRIDAVDVDNKVIARVDEYKITIPEEEVRVSTEMFNGEASGKIAGHSSPYNDRWDDGVYRYDNKWLKNVHGATFEVVVDDEEKYYNEFNYIGGGDYPEITTEKIKQDFTFYTGNSNDSSGSFKAWNVDPSKLTLTLLDGVYIGTDEREYYDFENEKVETENTAYFKTASGENICSYIEQANENWYMVDDATNRVRIEKQFSPRFVGARMGFCVSPIRVKVEYDGVYVGTTTFFSKDTTKYIYTGIEGESGLFNERRLALDFAQKAIDAEFVSYDHGGHLWKAGRQEDLLQDLIKICRYIDEFHYYNEVITGYGTSLPLECSQASYILDTWAYYTEKAIGYSGHGSGGAENATHVAYHLKGYEDYGYIEPSYPHRSKEARDAFLEEYHPELSE